MVGGQKGANWSENKTLGSVLQKKIVLRPKCKSALSYGVQSVIYSKMIKCSFLQV